MRVHYTGALSLLFLVMFMLALVLNLFPRSHKTFTFEPARHPVQVADQHASR